MKQQQLESKVYKGFKLAETVRLYKKDGSFNRQIKSALDNLGSKLRDNGHKLLSEYVGTHTKLLVDFNCSHEPHLITPNDYHAGYGCPKCAGLSPIQAEEDFNYLLNKNGHMLLHDYTNAKTPVLIDFNCGHEPHLIKPNNYKSGYGCPKCSGKSHSLAKDNFYQEVKRTGFKVLGEYKMALSKVKIQCNKGHIFDMKPNNFMSLSQRCPICNESKGERAIREYLESKGIAYICQYRFPKDTKAYDFYLPLENMIVEVHGVQHYEEVKIFHRGHKTFEDEQFNDWYKEEYAREMGCTYIVVDYREHNPNVALQRFIETYNKLREL